MTENLLTNEIPEKFKDPETGGLKADALLRSYKELEKKLSQGGGAPKSPDEYCIDCSHGMFEPDPEVNAACTPKASAMNRRRNFITSPPRK
jgi:hypothetical protein